MSELTKSNFEQSAHERYKDKRAQLKWLKNAYKCKICTYFKLCVLELYEKNAARGGVEGGPPSPPGGNSFTLYIHILLTLGGGEGGVRARISRERTAVVSGAIKRFSALFQERTSGFF